MSKAMSKSTLSIVENYRLPRWDELPDIALYMDQVIAFVDGALDGLFQHSGTPSLTKSMVNNYVKSKIIQAPVNKKYSKAAVASAIVICILKTCCPMDEISVFLRTGMHLGTNAAVYNQFCNAIEDALKKVFAGQISLEYSDIGDKESVYLLDTLALAFACKYFAQVTLLFPKKRILDSKNKEKTKTKDKSNR